MERPLRTGGSHPRCLESSRGTGWGCSQRRVLQTANHVRSRNRPGRKGGREGHPKGSAPPGYSLSNLAIPIPAQLPGPPFAPLHQCPAFIPIIHPSSDRRAGKHLPEQRPPSPACPTSPALISGAESRFGKGSAPHLWQINFIPLIKLLNSHFLLIICH